MTLDRTLQHDLLADISHLSDWLKQYHVMDWKSWSKQTTDKFACYLDPLFSLWRQAKLRPQDISTLSYVVLHIQVEESQILQEIEEASWWAYLKRFSDISGLASSQKPRNYLIHSLYHVGYITRLEGLTLFSFKLFAVKVFGDVIWQNNLKLIQDTLRQVGYENVEKQASLAATLALVQLVSRTDNLRDISPHLLHELLTKRVVTSRSRHFRRIALALHTLGYADFTQCIRYKPQPIIPSKLQDNIAPEWVEIAEQWLQTSIISLGSRKRIYRTVLQAGRWLAAVHPDITHPRQWTRQTALDYVKVVSQLRCYEWSSQPQKIGKELKSSSKQKVLDALRVYFTNLQSWRWIPIQFNPQRALATPTHIMNDIHPQPRVIQSDVWAKLLAAALNLTQEDLDRYLHRKGADQPLYHIYPILMVRTVAITWLFSGLRKNEIRRLRVGCIRWQTSPTETDHGASKICFLHYPANKTGPASLKPVDTIVGETIEAWKKQRPKQAPLLDRKSREFADLLFMYRGRGLGISYINQTLIPLLCYKAGIPQADSRGQITSHRARSTIASQLVNAEQGMSLTDIQQWLGHRNPETTEHYIQTNQQTMAKAYQDAGYFERNLRSIRVLIDQQAIRTSDTLTQDRWLYYDLGHGYCSYSFFHRCPHRMICKQCSHYLAKDSHLSQMLEAREHLMEAYQTIELTDDEKDAIDTDLTRLQTWIDKLQAVPTPDNTTSGFVPLDDITVKD